MYTGSRKILSDKKIALLVDPDGKSISKLHPDVVVDAILAKKTWEQESIWQKLLLV